MQEIILSTVRVETLGSTVRECQRVVSFETPEGSYNRRIVVSDIYAGWVVEALLKDREEAQNRIAELEDQIRSLEQGAAWVSLSPAERDHAIRMAT